MSRHSGRLAAPSVAAWRRFIAKVNLLLLNDIQFPRYTFSFSFKGEAPVLYSEKMLKFFIIQSGIIIMLGEGKTPKVPG